MSPNQMSPESREALAGLPAKARREFEGWFRNKLQLMTGTNDLEAGDQRLNHVTRGLARQRNRAAELALEELAEIFGEHKGEKRAT